MTQEGVCRFLQDLHFKLDDKIVLVLAWRFKAQVQGEFTKDEFYNAMNELGYFGLFLYLYLELVGKVFFFSRAIGATH